MPIIRANERTGNSIQGADAGGSVSLILDASPPGGGPRLHRHDYDETWVVQEGRIRFQAGDETLEAGPGDVVVVPAGAPHKFTNLGPATSRLVCIHASPTIVGEWLE